MEDGPVEALLQRGGDILVNGIDRRVGCARREELLRQMVPRAEVELALDPRPVVSKQRHFPRAVRLQDERIVEEGGESLGVPVRRQPHDLVLVGVEVEAEMQRHDRVEDPDRVRRRDPQQRLEMAVAHVIRGPAVGLAHAVDHDHGALVPTGGECRRRGVRAVVVDVAHGVRARPG